MLLRKSIQHFIHCQYLLVRIRSREVQLVGADLFEAAAVAHRKFAARPVNENAPHGLCRRRKKVGPVLKAGPVVSHQAQPGLMHQRGGLQRLVSRLA